MIDTGLCFLGAIPVFTDIVPSTFNMCPDSLESQIQGVLKEGKLIPKVIVAVDLFGQPADYDRILPIAEKYGLNVIEDGAQGFGGSIRGRRADCINAGCNVIIEKPLDNFDICIIMSL